MALGNPSLCPNIWEKNDTHLLHDFSYSPQNKAVNFQLTEKRVRFSIQGLISELMWWYDSALTQTFKEMNMIIFFFLLYVGTQNWMNQRIKRVRENVANSLLSTHTPSDRCQGTKATRGPSFRGDTGSSDRRQTASTVMLVWNAPWGLGGYQHPLQAHTGASLSPGPLRMLCTSQGCASCNRVAFICCAHSLLVLYFHQPRPADLFQVRHYHSWQHQCFLLSVEPGKPLIHSSPCVLRKWFIQGASRDHTAFLLCKFWGPVVLYFKMQASRTRPHPSPGFPCYE